MKIQLLTTSRFADPLPWKTFLNYFCRICHWMYLSMLLWSCPAPFRQLVYSITNELFQFWWVFPGVFVTFVNRAWNGTNNVQVGSCQVNSMHVEHPTHIGDCLTCHICNMTTNVVMQHNHQLISRVKTNLLYWWARKAPIQKWDKNWFSNEMRTDFSNERSWSVSERPLIHLLCSNASFKKSLLFIALNGK